MNLTNTYSGEEQKTALTTEKINEIDPETNKRIWDICFEAVMAYFADFGTKSQKNAPRACAKEIMERSEQGFIIKKEGKDPETGETLYRASPWRKAPKTLAGRVVVAAGRGFSSYLNQRNHPLLRITGKKAGKKLFEGRVLPLADGEPVASAMNVEEQQEMLNKYLAEYRLTSVNDRLLAEQAIKVLVHLNRHLALVDSRGDTRLANADSVKKLTETFLKYTEAIGINAKQRLEKREQAFGTVAELAKKYEQRKRELPGLVDTEIDEELDMLLDKYERTKPNGDREISAKAFEVHTTFTVDEAYERLKRTPREPRPYEL